MSLVCREYINEKGKSFICNIIVVRHTGADEFWFKARDIANFLYPQFVTRYYVDSKWQRQWMHLQKEIPSIENLKGKWSPNAVFLSEPGIYAYASRIRHTSESMQFADWVYGVVMPELRQDCRPIQLENESADSVLVLMKKEFELKEMEFRATIEQFERLDQLQGRQIKLNATKHENEIQKVLKQLNLLKKEQSRLMVQYKLQRIGAQTLGRIAFDQLIKYEFMNKVHGKSYQNVGPVSLREYRKNRSQPYMLQHKTCNRNTTIYGKSINIPFGIDVWQNFFNSSNPLLFGLRFLSDDEFELLNESELRSKYQYYAGVDVSTKKLITNAYDLFIKCAFANEDDCVSRSLVPSIWSLYNEMFVPATNLNSTIPNVENDVLMATPPPSTSDLYQEALKTTIRDDDALSKLSQLFPYEAETRAMQKYCNIKIQQLFKSAAPIQQPPNTTASL